MKPFLSIVSVALMSVILTPVVMADTAGERRWRLFAEISALEAESLRSQVKALEKKLELKDLDMHENRAASADQISFGEIPPVTEDGMYLAALTSTVDSAAERRETGGGTQPAKPPTSGADGENPEDIPTKGPRLTYNFQVLRPSTRVFFDTGGDDPGEVDFFKEGDIGFSVDFLTLSADYAVVEEKVWLSAFVAGGLASAVKGGEATGNAAVFMWSAGLSISFKELPLAFEVGVMQGISASESLSGDNRNDAAFFVGMSLDRLIKKTPLTAKKGKNTNEPP